MGGRVQGQTVDPYTGPPGEGPTKTLPLHFATTPAVNRVLNRAKLARHHLQSTLLTVVGGCRCLGVAGHPPYLSLRVHLWGESVLLCAPLPSTCVLWVQVYVSVNLRPCSGQPRPRVSANESSRKRPGIDGSPSMCPSSTLLDLEPDGPLSHGVCPSSRCHDSH